ncbi:hypothetical protein DAI22_12g186650 [Oryza sativa Japonica Group]|nr:hypothetical protein DAI22_12g186650 [Oryza sativa Japonica Group]
MELASCGGVGCVAVFSWEAAALLLASAAAASCVPCWLVLLSPGARRSWCGRQPVSVVAAVSLVPEHVLPMPWFYQSCFADFHFPIHVRQSTKTAIRLPPFEFFSGYGDLDLGSFFLCVSYRLVPCRVCCSG